MLGDVHNMLGDYTKALQLVDSSLVYSQELDNQIMQINGLNVKGNIFRNLGNYKNATEIYLKVNRIAEEIKNISLQIDAKHNIGLIKNEIGSHKEAIQIFKDNLSKISSLPEVNRKISNTNTIIALASAYTDVDPQEALTYTKTLKEISTRDNNQIAFGYYYMFEGKIAYKQEKYQNALQLMNSAEDIFTALGYERNLFTVYRFKGKCYYELQKFKEAITNVAKLSFPLASLAAQAIPPG